MHNYHPRTPSVLHILRMRQARRSPAGWLGLGCSGLFSLAAVLGLLLLALGYQSLARDLPSPDALAALLEPPGFQPTRFYDRSGEHLLLTLENPAAPGRQYIEAEALPPDLVDATVASADPGFLRHPGFSLSGILDGEHPTLAQRLVSDILLWDEPPGVRRALRERLLAAQVTARFGRDRVLAWYLNSANYGRLAYGADAAARVYFGKPAAELTLAESALLADLSRSPDPDPYSDPEMARQETGQVLQAMQTAGQITQTELDEALSQELTLAALVQPPTSLAPAFLTLALDQLQSKYPLHQLARGGLRVITTLDYDLQTQANCTASAQLARLEKRATAAGPCPAAEQLPALPATQNLPTGLEAQAVLLDPQTGEVLALSAVQGEEAGAVLPALSSESTGGLADSLGLSALAAHPTGSLLTPFIYFSAFTRGWTPATQVWDIPPDGQIEAGQPLPAGYEGPLRLRMALANDRLAPAAQVLSAVGSENVQQVAREFGLPATGSTGGEAGLMEESEATLLQLAQAYGVFANQGILAGAGQPQGTSSPDPLQPVSILRIEDSTGQLDWPSPASQRRSITSPQLAYLITDVLSDETARWHSLGHPNLLEIGRPAAAKLGRVISGKDAWTVGYTPQLVAGAWVGYAKEMSEGLSQPLSPEPAAALWRALALYATRTAEPAGWTPPAGVITLDVCERSGLLPTPDCPEVVQEVFLAGSEPSEPDTLFKRIAVNRETGRLASIFTPLERVEERTYLNVPPEAAAWARAASLPVPPDTYDVIFRPLSSSPDVQISSPEMFATVHGEVTVRGSAAGDDFLSYRLQVGEGLYPRTWVQVGQASFQPVLDGKLGMWDTRGLEGPVVLQLLVIRADNRVDTAAVQVTVDNQPPELEVPYPAEGQVFDRTEDHVITFQARVSDNLSIRQVEFRLDGDPVAVQVEAPYAYPWRPVKGEHVLQVKATDQAGNTTQTEVEFVVR